jgi:hypothetical protein
MVLTIKDNTMTAKKMEKVFSHGLMVAAIREHLKAIT